MKKIILASDSPRRHELMKSAGFSFDIIPAQKEEIIQENAAPKEAVIVLALQKAKEVFALNPDCIIIGADTIVAIDGEILGKPRDKAEAFAMLKKLSGRTHSVFTGVAICETNRNETFAEQTKVEFYDLSDDEINAYIETREPFDKAGAYGIQGKGSLLIKSISGDYYNIMGLPIAKLSRILQVNF